MAVGLALEDVAPTAAEGPGATLSIPEGATAVLAGREGAGKTRLARLLAGMEPGRGTVRIGDEAHDLAAGPLPARTGLGAVLDPPVLQSGLVCGDNIRLGERAAPRGRRRRAEELVELLGIDPDALRLHPERVPVRTRQLVSLAQMLAAGKRVVVWDLARDDLWTGVHRARRIRDELTWLVLVRSARTALAHGECAGILDRGRVTCFGPRDTVGARLAFTVALRAEDPSG